MLTPLHTAIESLFSAFGIHYYCYCITFAFSLFDAHLLLATPTVIELNVMMTE